jgi:hypothetical protein
MGKRNEPRSFIFGYTFVARTNYKKPESDLFLEWVAWSRKLQLKCEPLYPE